MPWRGPEEPGEFPTLGYQVAEYIEASCAIPDGDHRGDPFLLTDEMLRFLLWYYRINPDAHYDDRARVWKNRWHFSRGGQLVRPQKWGKGPFSAGWVCAEADGPVLFDGWDADGEPVGRPWATPWIQCTAVSEDQTDNVWRALVPMIELGSLTADIPDTGETRINLPGGGKIEPVTSAARSRLGQRITAAVQDESHSWLARNGGVKLADNQRRNLAGMGGRFLETSNAWDPTEQSVAQLTSESPVGVYVDYPKPLAGSVRNKRERRRVMKHAYGDSWWVDLDRIDDEVEALLTHDPAQAERFFLNRSAAGETLAFDPDRWNELADLEGSTEPGKLITIGVKGARFTESLAIVATDVLTGRQWPLGIWERPESADDDYEHPENDVDGAMVEAFEQFNPWRAYIDPQQIEHLVDRWRGRWGEKRVIPWYTNRPRAIAYAVRAYRQAQTAGDVSHDGDADLARHIGNARKMPTNVKDEKGRFMWSLQKDRPTSTNEIAGAFAGVLSWEARGDAIAAGALEAEEPGELISW